MNIRTLVPSGSAVRTFYTRHILHIHLILVVATLFAAILFFASGRIGHHPEVILGCILSLSNAFLGYVFIERAFRFNNNVFLFVAFSGMALRFFLTIAAVASILLTGVFHTASFIGSFMAFYVVCMTVEVMHTNKKIDAQRLARVYIKK